MRRTATILALTAALGLLPMLGGLLPSREGDEMGGIEWSAPAPTGSQTGSHHESGPIGPAAIGSRQALPSPGTDGFAGHRPAPGTDSNEHDHRFCDEAIDPLPGPARFVDDQTLAALQELEMDLVHRLATGAIDGADVLDRVRAETRPEVLDVLFGALLAGPPDALTTAALAAWRDLARADGDPERRRIALLHLGAAPDPDRATGRFLVDIARHDHDRDARLAALASIRSHQSGPSATGETDQRLLDLVDAERDEGVRAEAVRAIEPAATGIEAVDALGRLLESDPSLEVRFAAVERLGSAAGADRAAGVAWLERTHGGEKDPGLRAETIHQLVRLGRHEALASLRRLDESDPDLRQEIADYIRILEAGEIDLDRIHRAKEALDLERLASR